MTVPLPPPAEQPRCPSCGALTPVGESGRPPEWCSLCLTPLHPSPPEPPPEQVPEPAAPLPPPVGVEPLVGADEAVRGELDDKLVDRMLVELRAEQGSDPWVTRSQQVEGRGQRLVLGVVVGVAVMLLIIVLAYVVGMLLG